MLRSVGGDEPGNDSGDYGSFGWCLLYCPREDTELGGLAHGFGPAAAVERCKRVCHVHLDRARAEPQAPRDLLVGVTLGDLAEDLKLAGGEASLMGTAGSTGPECARQGLPQLAQLPCRRFGERPRAQPFGTPRGLPRVRDGRIAPANRGRRRCSPQLALDALARQLHLLEQRDGVLELIGCASGVALQQRELAERVRKRGQRLGMTEPGDRLAENVTARPQALAIAQLRETAGRPTNDRDRSVPFVDLTVPRKDRDAALAGCGRIPCCNVAHCEPPASGQLCERMIELPGERRRLDEERLPLAQFPAQDVNESDEPQRRAPRGRLACR
jgi:hypothetical protein